jgi:heat shock transcription factor
MQLRMPPANSRKRPAPGTSPAVQNQPAQPAFAPAQLSNDQFLQWGQPQNGNYPDPTTFNTNIYGGEQVSQGPYPPSVPATSTQLARRPMNRSLVSTAPRSFDDMNDPWGGFGGDPMDVQNSNGMEESDNIELLEEKAAVAKREAQAKRKQIPPFVQKLSR